MASVKSKQYPYQWPDGSYHSIPYAKHAANVKAAQRQPQHPAGQPGSRGSVYKWDTGTAADASEGAAPPVATPAPLAAAAPIAAPPVFKEPFLTLGDQASKALEVADVDNYLSGIHTQTQQADIDATQKLGDIDTAEGRNLEATDWNTAGRGIAQSSIRDTSKANIQADSARARTATQETQKRQHDFEAGEIHRSDTVVKPAIDTKWNERATQNAEAASDADPGTSSGGGGGAAPKPAAPTSNVYKPGTNEWAAYAVAHGESWKQVGGKWYRKGASGAWIPQGNAGE